MSEFKKIFIVDDDEMFAKMLFNHLSLKTHHQYRLFQNGADFLKQLEEKPDWVILDYYLESQRKKAVNGMQVLETIKKQHRHIPAIMLSGQESSGLAAQTIAKGAAHYVIKGKASFAEIENIISQI